MEKDVPSAVIRAEEPEAFSFEVGDHRAALLAGGALGGFAALGGARGRAAALVAYTLLDQGQVIFGPTRNVWRLGGGHFEVRVALAGLFE